jgi:subtilisin family serine protease
MKLSRFSHAVAGIALLAVFLTGARAGHAQDAWPGAEAPHTTGEVLIQFRAGVSAQQQQNAHRRGGVVPVERIRAATRAAGQLELAVFPQRQSLAVTIWALEADPSVAFAEPNWIYYHHDVANDPYYTNGSLWGMYGDATSPANPYGSQAGEAWNAGNVGSSSVHVGVIDEGIDFNHPDLAANIWTNPYDPVDGVDNDGNGYVDDIHGWDFANNDNSIYDGKRRTDTSTDAHGTHVSGTIGGKGGNGIGVAGVNWYVTIISAKFLGANGGTSANSVKAVDYITDLKTRHNLNIPATNNSWGGGGYSQALADAIGRANTANILFVAAAGNGGSDGVGDNNDAVASYPSNYDIPNVIAVAAINSNGTRASFSNYGATTVDLGAPGSGIYSTTPKNTYSSYSGTSMATPHVTGAVALYASTHPGASASQIKNAILTSAVATTSLSGITVTGGRLDANAALFK